LRSEITAASRPCPRTAMQSNGNDRICGSKNGYGCKTDVFAKAFIVKAFLVYILSPVYPFLGKGRKQTVFRSNSPCTTIEVLLETRVSIVVRAEVL
jgi:hypothetical protein